MSSKRIFSGTVASYLHTTVSLLSNLVLVPMYLLYFSKEEYGLWLVVLSVVSYLGFSNLGITQSVANYVASTNAKNDYDGIKSIVATGFWLYMSIIILLMMMIIGVVLVVPVEDFLNVPESLHDVVIPVLLISCAFFFIT